MPPKISARGRFFLASFSSALIEVVCPQAVHEGGGAGFFLRRGVAVEAYGGIRAAEHHFAACPVAVAEPLVHERADPGDALAELLEVHGAEAVAEHLHRGAEEGQA